MSSLEPLDANHLLATLTCACDAKNELDNASRAFCCAGHPRHTHTVCGHCVAALAQAHPHAVFFPNHALRSLRDRYGAQLDAARAQRDAAPAAP